MRQILNCVRWRPSAGALRLLDALGRFQISTPLAHFPSLSSTKLFLLPLARLSPGSNATIPGAVLPAKRDLQFGRAYYKERIRI